MNTSLLPPSGKDTQKTGWIDSIPRSTWYVLMNSVVLAWAVVAAVVAFAHRGIPEAGWLMVHTMLLGAATTAILIWSQHFADTLVRHPAAFGRRSHALRLAGHTVGAVLVATGIVAGQWAIVLAGGIIVGLVAVVHASSLGQQLKTALPSRFGKLVGFYIAASLALAVGVGLGVWMARADVTAAVHDRLYLAHISLNLFGWVGLTVLGTVILLWPTVLHAKITEPAQVAARRSLPLLVFGLLLVTAASVFDLQIGVGVGLLVYLAGVIMVLVPALGQAKQMPPQNFAGWSIGMALLWLAGCVAALAIVVITSASWADAINGMQILVPAFVVGFVAQIVSGAMSYLLPVVLGGGPTVTKATNAVLDQAAVFRVTVINAGSLLYLAPLPSLVKVTVSFLVYAMLLWFLILAVRAIVVARRVRTEANPTERPRARVKVTDEEAAEAASAQMHSRSGMLVAAAGALVLVVTLGVALDPAGAGIGVGGSSGVEASGKTTTVQMTMKDMRFTPDVIEVPYGDQLVIELTNADDMVHDLTLANGVQSSRMSPGAFETVDAGVIGSDLDGWCSITGHRQLGMVFQVRVIGGPSEGAQAPGQAETPAPDAGHLGHRGDGATGGSSAADDIDLMKEPGADFTAYDAALAPAPAAAVHRLTLTVTDLVVDVAPGVSQRLWVYNGTAPGPTLRGKVGDKFEITLTNDGSIGHSIDFHAGALAPDKPMRTIGPGESLDYVFTATRSGIWMYHCSTMPMSAHIANGMFGAVIIDPAGLEPVDREYVLLQSEYYLGPQSGEVDAAKVTAEEPDLVVFNGYANQYKYRPLAAKVGEKVRIWVLDPGPNRSEAFHVIGGQFDTVFKEGEYTLKNGGSTGTGGSQVLDLAVAQGGFVELTFPEAGNYPFVNHVMVDAERGAAGVFHVTE
ncbi:multicopper oxidase domain-containing protein [Homoserinimonas sp. OAct 916]|uniref:multicopper oxidase domain-containing protein n=1 Tax=Homoserinimonas sp. OAct 916 TaxID=2211450 RepID=UPI001E28C7E8|nr:multicopper oxidase domain-containing protein [Homoserinimonas sp. OAct 916]